MFEMKRNYTRRDALRLAVFGGISPLAFAASEVDAKDTEASRIKLPLNLPPEDRQAPNLTAYLYGGQVLFRWNNVVIATYRACPLQKYPYFSNLAGPVSGLPLTTESSMPFPHHRGLWLGCEPLNNGDYWSDNSLDKGQIRACELKLGKTTDRSAEVCHKSTWVRKDAPSPFQDERCITFQVHDHKTYFIDFDLNLTALEDINIKRAKHSFFALRAAPDISTDGGGKLMNANGNEGESGTFGKPANWCGYHGKRANRPDIVEGIAMMNHPENPWKDCPWFTRDYGHLSPAPFNFLDRPWELAKGKSIRLRYRVVLHAGTPQEANLNQIYRDWLVS
jgi:hypothetical protein